MPAIAPSGVRPAKSAGITRELAKTPGGDGPDGIEPAVVGGAEKAFSAGEPEWVDMACGERVE